MYRLTPDVARSRARSSAAASTLVAMAPAAFALLALRRLEMFATSWLLGVLALVALLAATRALVAMGQLERHLASLSLSIDGNEQAPILVNTRAGSHALARSDITRIREIEGVLGGLRVYLRPGWDGERDSPAFVDVPRGGEGFGEVRAELGRVHPVERPQRRSRALRVGLGTLIVAAIFFLPFVLDEVFGRSKPVALAFVLALWIALRVIARR